MKKKREVSQELKRLLEYTADHHDIPSSFFVQSGIMIALQWVLGDAGSPVDRIKRVDAKVKRNAKCITKK